MPSARKAKNRLRAHLLDTGQDVSSLPEVYVIFFTEHDVLRRGDPVYYVERVFRSASTSVQCGDLFLDGTHIVYVNGMYPDDGTELGSLISDFRQTDPNKIRTKSLERRVRHFKESEEGQAEMCRIMEEIRQEGRQEEFCLFLKAMHKKNKGVTEMAELSCRSETEVIAALESLGLPIPN